MWSSRCDSVPIMIFLQIKLRDGVTRHHLSSQHFQGKMCNFKISSRPNTDFFKYQSMSHREQGVFLLKSNTKSGKAQTPDLTIRKMTMPVFLYLTFSPKRTWNVAAEVSPATIRADKHSLLCQPSSHPRQRESENRRGVKYMEKRHRWQRTNVRRIAGGTDEWSVCKHRHKPRQ